MKEWPTLPSGRTMDWGSGIKRTPNLEVFRGGDGYVYRYAKGLNNNPAQMTYVLNNASHADWAVLLPFLLEVEGTGETVRVKMSPEDPTGTKYGYFWVSGHDAKGDYLFNITVSLEQEFTGV